MPDPTSDKLTKLLAMLQKEPRDAFLLYAAALEYKKLDAPTQSIDYLDRTLQVDPNYCYAYYQKGQVYEAQGDAESARQSYRQGIAAATRSGDAKAFGELEGALSMIEV